MQMLRLYEPVDRGPARPVLPLPSARIQESLAWQEAAGRGLARARNNDGDVFIGSDSWQSLKQGGLGDCYFLSALGGLAARNPGAVRRLIHEEPDGRYTVRFFGHNRVTVRGDEVRGGVKADGKWANILECAWEKAVGNMHGKSVKNDGGDPGDAIRALTGRKARYIQVDQKNAADTIRSVRKCLLRGGLAVASTSGVARKGLVRDHAYTVLSVDDENHITLRNPWGRSPYTGAPPSDHAKGEGGPGSFTLDAATFATYFTDVHYA